jgi:hypothetical protein
VAVVGDDDGVVVGEIERDARAQQLPQSLMTFHCFEKSFCSNYFIAL